MKNLEISKKVLSNMEDWIGYDSGIYSDSADLQYSFKTIFKSTLVDANFHSEAKKVDSIFPNAKMGLSAWHNRKGWNKMLREKGMVYARTLKYNGDDIIFVFDEFTKKYLPGFEIKKIME